MSTAEISAVQAAAGISTPVVSVKPVAWPSRTVAMICRSACLRR
jgi:hypothetical protein